MTIDFFTMNPVVTHVSNAINAANNIKDVSLDGILSFFDKPKWKNFLLKDPSINHHLSASFPIFNTFFGLEVLIYILMQYDLAKSKNKNMEKTLNMIRVAANVSLVGVAVNFGNYTSLGGAAALGATSPFIFTGIMATNAVIDFAVAAVNLRAYFNEPEGTPEKTWYKKQAIKYSLSGTIALTLALGIAFTMVMATPIINVIAASVAVSIFTAVKVGMHVHNKKDEKTLLAAQLKKYTDINKKITTKKVSLSETTYTKDNIGEKIKSKSTNKTGYFYQFNIGQTLEQALDEGGKAKMNEAFLAVIQNKIDRLEKQNEGVKDQHYSFHSNRDNKKRSEKIAALRKLTTLIKRSESFIEITQLKEIENQHGNLYQSFFKHKGEVEQIFDAAWNYYTNPQLKIDALSAKINKTGFFSRKTQEPAQPTQAVLAQ